jgi:hypothetical protein
MSRLYALVTALSLAMSSAFADDPVPIGPKVKADPSGPVAKLTGPLKAKVGDQLVFTTEGSVGSDIKFTVNPPTVNFLVVKLVDEKDNIGAVFTPVRTGTFQIVMMLNQDGKTGFSTLTVTVEPPPPPPVPEKEYFPIRRRTRTISGLTIKPRNTSHN